MEKTTITSNPAIFSEKQLRENFPEEEPRWNPFAFFLPDFSGIFSGEGVKKSTGSSGGGASSGVVNSLKNTVSVDVLEERIALFVKGKSSPAAYVNIYLY